MGHLANRVAMAMLVFRIGPTLSRSPPVLASALSVGRTPVLSGIVPGVGKTLTVLSGLGVVLWRPWRCCQARGLPHLGYMANGVGRATMPFCTASSVAKAFRVLCWQCWQVVLSGSVARSLEYHL